MRLLLIVKCVHISLTPPQPLTTVTKFVNNGIYNLSGEAKYELNAIEINKNKNVAPTSLMKNYVSMDYSIGADFLKTQDDLILRMNKY